MGHSQRLRLRELRDVYLLVGECSELGADPQRWQEHMLRGLNSILGSRLGVAKCLRANGQPVPEPFYWVAVGADESEVRSVLGQYQQDQAYTIDPLNKGWRRWPRLLVASRPVLVADGDWYGSRAFNEYYRQARLDDALGAITLIRPRQWYHLSFHRVLRDGHFHLRHRRLLHLFQIEMARRLGTQWRLPLPGTGAPGELSPRLRQVLQLLLKGCSEKEVAAQLGISSHTVHDHVKALHRHLGVSSRGELLARGFDLGVGRCES